VLATLRACSNIRTNASKYQQGQQIALYFTGCLNAFGHLVQWCYKDNFSAQWEIDALIHAEEVGLKFEKTHKEKEALERLFGASWFFDCPLCNEWAIRRY
jgi:hypothetical protein